MIACLLNAAYATALVITFPFWVYKALRTGKYREGLWARIRGSPPAGDGRPTVWLHAVSVGEVLLLRPLLVRLQAERPELRLVLSTTTNTGYQLAREKYPGLAVFYAPLDFSWAVRRVFARVRPVLLVLVELELWPNLLWEAKRRGVPVAVVNARLSERSFRGYRRLRRFFQPLLAAVHWWGAQTETYAERIRQLDPKASVEVTGSMKFDGAPTDRTNPKTQALRALLGLRPEEVVWVAGSTQDPEERLVLEVFARLRVDQPRLRLVLVPRQRDRFDAVAALLAERAIDFLRRSRLSDEAPAPVPGQAEKGPVILVDTIGELAALWGLADVGYVGGSTGCGRGGQSMIEPAGYGVPVCFGPEVWNFQDTARRLLEIGGARMVHTPDEWYQTIAGWLKDPVAASAAGAAGRRYVLAQQGAVERTCAALLRLSQGQRPRQSAVSPLPGANSHHVSQ